VPRAGGGLARTFRRHKSLRFGLLCRQAFPACHELMGIRARPDTTSSAQTAPRRDPSACLSNLFAPRLRNARRCAEVLASQPRCSALCLGSFPEARLPGAVPGAWPACAPGACASAAGAGAGQRPGPREEMADPNHDVLLPEFLCSLTRRAPPSRFGHVGRDVELPQRFATRRVPDP